MSKKEAKKQGIAIIKQVGDAMVIYDANLRVFLKKVYFSS